ncbi:MAG: Crp/Fnr family transcriptional regulator [Gemmatimonadaceae bacterium]
MATANRPDNRLLSALPRDAFEEIEPHLERHSLESGLVLHKPGEPIRDLYFPVGCLISVTVTMRDDRTAETGVVGRRDVVGINAFMGGSETTQTEYVVQVPGDAVRVPADPLRDAFDRNQRLRAVLLKYTQAMIAQICQNAACNRLHSLEQRYARWLLETRERIASDDLRLTHGFISQMLGVRRAGVTEVTGRFQKEGMVRAERGRTYILDAPRLETISCECYEVVKEEYDRLLGA